MRLWLRDPIAMLADGGSRGLVVEDAKIVELVGKDNPASPCDAVFDAGQHVILPGLINAHHHFFRTLDSRSSQRDQQAAVSLVASAIPDLGRAPRS